MLTRCPHCQTHFRVAAEQLKIRQGKVRCGACQAVFDALDSLTDEVPVVSPTTRLRAEAASEGRCRQDGRGEAQPQGSVVTIGPMAAAANEVADDPGPRPPIEDGAPSPGASHVKAPPEIGGVPEPGPESVREPEPELVEEQPAGPAADAWEPVPAAPAAPRRWPWLVGVLALLLVGAGQLAYIFRTELAAVAPELRPALVSACEWLGCTVPRPFKPELVGIETSDLVPEGDGLLLTATLKNRAPFAQDFPHLELALTDARDEVLVRKVLSPADYLPAGHDPAQGFAARAELALRLALATDNVPAVGYRLYLFYP